MFPEWLGLPLQHLLHPLPVGLAVIEQSMVFTEGHSPVLNSKLAKSKRNELRRNLLLVSSFVRIDSPFLKPSPQSLAS